MLPRPEIETQEEVMFFDTDCGGVVHNIAYLRFIETARTLTGTLTGEARATLLYRMGAVSAERHEPDAAIRYYEQAMANTPPSIPAAEALEAIYRTRADWNGTVRALGVQAEGAATDEARVAALVKAARVETEVRHDRELASVYFAKVLHSLGCE